MTSDARDRLREALREWKANPCADLQVEDLARAAEALLAEPPAPAHADHDALAELDGWCESYKATLVLTTSMAVMEAFQAQIAKLRACRQPSVDYGRSLTFCAHVAARAMEGGSNFGDIVEAHQGHFLEADASVLALARAFAAKAAPVVAPDGDAVRELRARPRAVPDAGDDLRERIAAKAEEVADRYAENHHHYCGPSLPGEAICLRVFAEMLRSKEIP